jgi:hypothetical protein
MIYAANGNNDGCFNGARLISNASTPGWYFQYNSANGPLKLNNILRQDAVKKIVEAVISRWLVPRAGSLDRALLMPSEGPDSQMRL